MCYGLQLINCVYSMFLAIFRLAIGRQEQLPIYSQFSGTNASPLVLSNVFLVDAIHLAPVWDEEQRLTGSHIHIQSDGLCP